jgi:cytochrome c2
MKKTSILTLTCALAMGATALYGQSVAKGKEVFDQCSVCHNSDSTERKMGPGLKGLFKKAKMDSTGKAPTEANILEKINGGGNGMPSYKDVLSDEERKDLIAYLKTL